MRLQQVLDTVLPLNDDERRRWLVTLGWQMTISARAVTQYLLLFPLS